MSIDSQLRTEKAVIVTTSWDDGDVWNLKLAEKLARRGLPATFYIPTGSLGEGTTMSGSQLRELAESGFEIGAHTVTHPILSHLTGEVLRREVVDCKRTLEDILGREVPSFAYPKGRKNSEVARRLEEAGYRSARGLRMLSLNYQFPRFDMPFTVQAYPHRWAGFARNLAKRGAFGTLAKYSLRISRSSGWVELGKKMFDQALREGGAWHLVGHSWETERIGGWSELEEILDYVSGRAGVRYFTNGQLTELAHPAPAATLAQAFQNN